MKRRKRPKTKNARINDLLKGSIVSWSCEDPLAEVGEGEEYDTALSHTNLTKSLFIKNNYALVTKFITQGKHVWDVYVEMEFKNPEGTYFSSVSINPDRPVRFHNLDEIIADNIEEIFQDSNMDEYITTRVRATIL